MTAEAPGVMESRPTGPPRWPVALALVLRLGLAAILVYAGAAKLVDPSGFATEIGNYRLWPTAAPVLAAALPAVELVLGLAILAGPLLWRRAAAVAGAALMLVFTAAVGQVMVRGINVDCGCFGGSSGPVTFLTVGRNLVLLAAAAALFHLSPPGRPGRRDRTGLAG